jgi:hypothetical protein
MIKLPVQALEPKTFAPYGEIIWPRSSSTETSVEEPKLILTNGTPRLWIMKLKKRRLVFANMARRRVSQCLGSMQGKEWFIRRRSTKRSCRRHETGTRSDCGVSNSGRSPDQASRRDVARWPTLRP